MASINTPKAEWFYWCTILFSQTLGTALGDWLAGTDRGGLGLGYEYGALVFGLALAIVAALYFWTVVSRTILFWAAFILARPLGATLGDLLDKPLSSGGLLTSPSLTRNLQGCSPSRSQCPARRSSRSWTVRATSTSTSKIRANSQSSMRTPCRFNATKVSRPATSRAVWLSTRKDVCTRCAATA